MPAEPIEFLILQNLQAALEGIKTGNGYHHDVAQFAVKLDPEADIEALIAPDGPRPFVLVEVSPASWTYWPASQVDVVMPVIVHIVSDTEPTDDRSFMQTAFRLQADVEQAIAVDIGRGGRATDTRVKKATFAKLGAQVWASIDVDIKVNRTFGQPNAA